MYNYSISHSFYNKQNLTNSRSAMAYNFEPVSTSLASLIAHIRSGGAIGVGQYSDNHRHKNNFTNSSIVLIDFDDNISVDDIRAHKHSDLISFAFPSASSTPEWRKSRGGVLLCEYFYSAETYELFSSAIYSKFSDLNPDNTSDCSRLFFGSDNDSDIEYINESPLSPEQVSQLIAEYQAKAPVKKPKRGSQSVSKTSVELEKSLTDAKEPQASNKTEFKLIEQAREVIAIGDSGQRRHEKLYKQVYYPSAIALTQGKITQEFFESIALWAFVASGKEDNLILNGNKNPERALEQELSNALTFAESLLEEEEEKSKVELAQEAALAYTPLELPEPVSTITTKYVSDSLSYDYVKELAQDHLVFINTPTGTGKTSFGLGLLQSTEGYKIALAPLNGLGDNIATRALVDNDLKASTHLSSDLERPELYVSSFESLHKLASPESFSTALIEEPEQFINKIHSETTNKKLEANIETLEAIFRNVPTVLSGALYSPAVMAICAELSGKKIAHITSAHDSAHGTLEINISSPLATIQETLELAQSPELIAPVYFASTSKNQASEVYEMAIARGIKTFYISSLTSSSDIAKEFKRDPNSFIRSHDYSLYIATPSVGTGLDITEAMHLRGSATTRPLTPFEFQQQTGRVRAPESASVYVSISQGREPLSYEELYTESLYHLRSSMQSVGITEFKGRSLQMLRFACMLEAERRAHLQNYIGAYAYANKGKYKAIEYTEKQYTEEIKEERAQAKESLKDRRWNYVISCPELVPSKALLREREIKGLEVLYGEKVKAEAHSMMSFLGLPELTREIFEYMSTPKYRAQVYALYGLLGSGEREAQSTHRELDNGILEFNMRHEAKKLKARHKLLALTGFSIEDIRKGKPSDVQYTEPEFYTLYNSHSALFDEIFRQLKIRSDYSSTPFDAFRQAMREMGIQLKSVAQKRVEGKRYHVYGLDIEAFSINFELASLAISNEQKLAQEPVNILKNIGSGMPHTQRMIKALKSFQTFEGYNKIRALYKDHMRLNIQ